MRYYIIAILTMLTLSVGSASCSEDEPIQGTGQQVTPGNGSGSGDMAVTIMAIIPMIMTTITMIPQ